MVSSKQGTLSQDVVFEGLGIHTGKNCKVTVRPAAEGTGRRFLSSGTEIPARVDYVVSCDRSTILGHQDVRVHTPEHLLSAMASCGIDNAVIELTGPEIPIIDGSALRFCQDFQTAGIVEQQADANPIIPDKPFSVHGSNGDLVLVIPADELSYQYVLHYDHPMLGCQVVDFDPNKEDFKSMIAPARTFALWEEVKPLLDRGLAQGGSLDNALVVYQDHYSTPLTVESEPVRHKCLDLIGDFALLDARIQAKVIAVRAGHRLHVECARSVWQGMREI